MVICKAEQDNLWLQKCKSFVRKYPLILPANNCSCLTPHCFEWFFQILKAQFLKVTQFLPKRWQASLRDTSLGCRAWWIPRILNKKTGATSNTILSCFLLYPYLFFWLEPETRNTMTLWLQKVFLYFSIFLKIYIYIFNNINTTVLHFFPVL